MDITEQQNELIEANGGKPTPELAAQLLEQALNGETATPAETGGVPSTTQVQTEGTTPTDGEGNTQNAGGAQAQQQIDESQLNAENAVLLAKDGKHTIPYDRLADARKGEQEWKQKYDEAQQQLAHLQAEAQQRKEEGQAATLQDNQASIAQQAINQGIDPAIFGDFSEKDLAAGIQQLVDSRVAQMVDQRVNAALSPLHQQQQISAEQAHFNEIFTAHPDAESIVESQEFGKWIGKQPSFLQSAYNNVVNQGSAAQVVELLGLYKAETQSTQAAQPNDAVKAAAQQAVKQAQTQVPHSLSDLPAGSPSGVSRDERVAAMSPAQMLEEMDNWTPEQIDQFMNRRV
ncbi:hypothetical protein F975_01651 [Acinetobacter sp. ANC 3789]|uniref:hypothetical protein n=1 Tax=Acinetobacter sp. ANC 3789 TaxID=1217714 RepID=UPI0002CE4567|nr:hypothetical protein [Acinetobacter sp. ANC 3789]ENU80597.1 hypothetical protein F975_01651 [Acinetobacter sp. ANC 3789]